MNTDAAKAAFSHARRLSPSFVSGESSDSADLIVGFFGHIGPAATNRMLSFQGSLYRELRIFSKLASIEAGCIECTYDIGGADMAIRLSRLIEEGRFDSLAYRYRILFVRFPSSQNLDEVFFERDSLYR
ncbi:MAG: hypothetical protein OQK05_11680 [Pseudopelagicola sp.]|nr:hypothetical protein [Pseudopelagicola sp.]